VPGGDAFPALFPTDKGDLSGLGGPVCAVLPPGGWDVAARNREARQVDIGMWPDGFSRGVAPGVKPRISGALRTVASD
jgi:hypothetical protein